MEPIIDAEESNRALRIIKSIKEIPNPAYKKTARDRKQFTPVQGSIRASLVPLQKSLSEQIVERGKQYDIRVLEKIQGICDQCPDCSDCSWSGEARALDLCRNVKRQMAFYTGVING